jgi:hypothetical protein
MNNQQLSKTRLYFTVFTTLIVWAMLAWQFTHQGVPSHYLLQDPNLPELSNWWGALLLPVLSWVMLGRIQQRLLKSSPEKIALQSKKVFISFFIAVVYGVTLSFCFLNGYEAVSSVMFPSILFFAIFFRVYRAEFILAFILSMSFTFGAVLPTIFGTLIAISSFIVFSLVQFIFSRVKSMMAPKPAI